MFSRRRCEYEEPLSCSSVPPDMGETTLINLYQFLKNKSNRPSKVLSHFYHSKWTYNTSVLTERKFKKIVKNKNIENNP